MDLALAMEDSKIELERELERLGVPSEIQPGLFETELSSTAGSRLPQLVFARQLLPHARPLTAASIRAWAEALAEAVIGVLPDADPWTLHVFPFQPVLETERSGARAWHTHARSRSRVGARAAPASPSPGPGPAKGAGLHRCRLIRETLLELLQKRRRHLLRQLRSEPAPFEPNESLVQLMLLSPEHGMLSIAPAPLPFEQRHVLSHFPAGYVPLASDKAPPSRAFAKLLEAELRLGRRIQAPETCVDLGASPGSWTYVAAKRGARVTAVDRSELRADLMRSPNVRFERGDAFRFEPPRPVDWLICDVIAAAERSADLLRRWLRNGWCRRFVVTLKLDDAASREVLERLEADLLQLTSEHSLLRLCANKKEVCAFGSATPRR
jgi:23S rRNA (cytidine2498-2'-O)-methyltransferase